jgi:hypothetical protein
MASLSWTIRHTLLTKSVLKGKGFSKAEDIKSSVKKLTDIPVEDFKTVLNNGLSAGNIVKNCREITLKKISLETYFPIHTHSCQNFPLNAAFPFGLTNYNLYEEEEVKQL